MTEDTNTGYRRRDRRLSDSPSRQTGNSAAADDAGKIPKGTPDVRRKAKPTLRFLQEHWQILSSFAAALGFLITTVLLWQTIETSKSIAMVTLTRELMDDLYANETASKIEEAIVDCRVIYKGNGGEFTYQQVNDFLAIFENVGFFHSIGALDYKTVDYAFGARIIETFLYRELQDYIAGLRSEKGGQPKAYVYFEKIGRKLTEDPSNRQHVERYARPGCPGGYKGEQTE